MDLNGDGAIDILSGSYSRQDADMAGLFQVLWGKQGTFASAEVLKGSDGQPLIITPSGKGGDVDLDKICTRPFAVDLDGDGKLDIVSGNFAGTFALFRGEGKGKFAAKNTWLTDGSQPLHVDAHGDPCFVDWNGDGDLDLVSGSGSGGVFLFENTGTKKQPRFAKARTLVQPTGHVGGSDDEPRFGDAHLKAPQSATRVWADDVNGDGKVDLLIGDTVSLMYVAKGLDEAKATKELAAWSKRYAKLMTERDGKQSASDRARFDKAYEDLQKERAKIVRDERTGFVWVMYRK